LFSEAHTVFLELQKFAVEFSNKPELMREVTCKLSPHLFSFVRHSTHARSFLLRFFHERPGAEEEQQELPGCHQYPDQQSAAEAGTAQRQGRDGRRERYASACSEPSTDGYSVCLISFLSFFFLFFLLAVARADKSAEQLREELGSQLALWKIAEIVWHLCDIFFISSKPESVITEPLVTWLQHFDGTCHPPASHFPLFAFAFRFRSRSLDCLLLLLSGSLCRERTNETNNSQHQRRNKEQGGAGLSHPRNWYVSPLQVSGSIDTAIGDRPNPPFLTLLQCPPSVSSPAPDQHDSYWPVFYKYVHCNRQTPD
jgi:hypothetical protein